MPRNLKNIQQKPKMRWFSFNYFCPSCQEMAKQELNSHRLNWRFRKGKFEVRGINRQTLEHFFYTHGIGRHNG